MMLHPRHLTLLVLAISSSACGGGSNEMVAAGTTGSGGSTTSTTSATSSASGTGGSTATACADPFIDVKGDGADQHLAYPCAGSFGQSSPGPWGGIAIDSLSAQSSLGITGCAGDTMSSTQIVISRSDASAPGMYADAIAFYRDSQGAYYDYVPPGGTLTITALGGIGEPIEGSFAAAVHPSGGGKDLSLSGTFRVCRMPDQVGGD